MFLNSFTKIFCLQLSFHPEVHRAKKQTLFNVYMHTFVRSKSLLVYSENHNQNVSCKWALRSDFLVSKWGIYMWVWTETSSYLCPLMSVLFIAWTYFKSKSKRYVSYVQFPSLYPHFRCKTGTCTTLNRWMQISCGNWKI